MTAASRPSVGEGRRGIGGLDFTRRARPSLAGDVLERFTEGFDAGLGAVVEGLKMEVGARPPGLGGWTGRSVEGFGSLRFEGSSNSRLRRLNGLKEMCRR